MEDEMSHNFPQVYFRHLLFYIVRLYEWNISFFVCIQLNAVQDTTSHTHTRRVISSSAQTCIHCTSHLSVHESFIHVSNWYRSPHMLRPVVLDIKKSYLCYQLKLLQEKRVANNSRAACNAFTLPVKVSPIESKLDWPLSLIFYQSQ